MIKRTQESSTNIIEGELKSSLTIKYYFLGVLIYKVEVNGNKESRTFTYSFLLIPFYKNIEYR